MRTKIRVPATTANLGPGFDCLGLALDLWNEFEFETVPGEGGQTIEVEGFGAGRLPGDASNLVLQSFNRAFQILEIQPPGAAVQARNGFPIGSGLGSSASAIAAGVLAALAFAGEPGAALSALRIAAGIEGHPDNVSAALLGGLTASMMEQGSPVSVRAPLAAGWIAGVVVPMVDVSTSEMRAALPASVSFKDAVFNIGRTALVVRAFEAGDEGLLRSAMDDRLHQPARLPRIPGAGDALEAARAAGAACALSGAGPGLIAFSLDADRVGAAVGAMQGGFETRGIETWTWTGGFSEGGAEQVTVPAR